MTTNPIIARIATIAVIALAAVGLIAASHPDVIRPRMQTSLAQSFTNLYFAARPPPRHPDHGRADQRPADL